MCLRTGGRCTGTGPKLMKNYYQTFRIMLCRLSGVIIVEKGRLDKDRFISLIYPDISTHGTIVLFIIILCWYSHADAKQNCWITGILAKPRPSAIIFCFQFCYQDTVSILTLLCSSFLLRWNCIIVSIFFLQTSSNETDQTNVNNACNW